ncbi:MAG: PaaI family thioesterase [Alphaproteobacteria bacterium]|nr:MAG: PaaI family thioesterase [Alphaproteobacteria bacterium]
MAHVPHAQQLGMQVVQVRREACTAKIPYDDKLVGDPDTGVVHGGVITSLLDNTSGVAVTCALDVFRTMATLDLRIDYMHPATPGSDIFGFCHCFKVTRNVAFVRGIAYHDSPDNPIATSMASFMLGTQGSSVHRYTKGADT